MNYGLYLSANGALTSMYRQDVIANNLANLQTVGFKPDMVATRQRLPQRLEDPSAMADPQEMLERLGGGHLLEPTAPLLKQGTISVSNNPLDLAIEGDGFFTVESGDSKRALLSRDGRFTVNSDGQLVMATSGKRVLDAEGGSIQLDQSLPVTINFDGRIMQNGGTVARLGLVQPSDPKQLAREGESLFALNTSQTAAMKPASGRVIQGSVELSAVDPILALNDLMNASKAASANLKMMQYHDNTMSLAINTLGRVA